MHDVGLVVGHGVDPLIAGGLRDLHFQSHGLEKLADEVLELVPVHLQQVGPRVDASQCIDRVGESVLCLLELDHGLDRLQVVGVRREDRFEVLQARLGLKLIQHKLGEVSSAGGRADQVKFFGLPGRAVRRGHDAVEHDSIHNVFGRR